MAAPRIEIYKRMTFYGKRWFFRVIAGNNQIVAQSEAYNSKDSAEHGADALRWIAVHGETVDAPR